MMSQQENYSDSFRFTSCWFRFISCGFARLLVSSTVCFVYIQKNFRRTPEESKRCSICTLGCSQFCNMASTHTINSVFWERWPRLSYQKSSFKLMSLGSCSHSTCNFHRCYGPVAFQSFSNYESGWRGKNQMTHQMIFHYSGLLVLCYFN